MITARLTLILLFTMAMSMATSGAYGRKKKEGVLVETVKNLNSVDTNYIEPQHYNFTVMLQSTMNYDIYWMRDNNGQSIKFAPDVFAKVGPYVGWRWCFFGYTFDLQNSFGQGKKREWQFSLYSSKIGVDLFYRRTGNDYKIRSLSLNDGIDTKPIENADFDGFSVSVTGANVYYIFNNKRFSYPAAYSQSTCQKRSAGSWMVGLGYTRHKASVDDEKLRTTISKHLPAVAAALDSGEIFREVEFSDINISCGYGYNWVFAKHWLANATLSLALSFKQTSGESKDFLNNFDLKKFSVDGIGRAAVVYNNMRWYAGFSGTLHSYNYSKSQFSASTMFGCINVYFGYNFGLRKEYKKR